ncbi:MAG: WYL domain-containing protein [Lachnospiraceae bacterium]|nr:WYL domain-containing protein [Lachnospiraceae bacterium]
MKIDRMLEIIIYLLNHGHVPASYLADRFGVSVRTIQRDMISISASGIPVYADAGKKGGYSILPNYKIKNTDIKDEEQQLVIKALESLATSYSNDTLNSLIEKYNLIVEKEGGQKVFWDFSVTRENKSVQGLNTVLEQAISQKKYISFEYRNANGECFHPTVQPLAIHYKWYAWYLFAYDEQKMGYRTFKVARMEKLVVEEKEYTTNHGDIQKRMKESEQAYYKTCIPIEVHFDRKESALINEYFPDCPIEQLEGNLCRIFILNYS